jgi:hypothetical protein
MQSVQTGAGSPRSNSEANWSFLVPWFIINITCENMVMTCLVLAGISLQAPMKDVTAT